MNLTAGELSHCDKKQSKGDLTTEVLISHSCVTNKDNCGQNVL